jgi:hypothetical protein
MQEAPKIVWEVLYLQSSTYFIQFSLRMYVPPPSPPLSYTPSSSSPPTPAPPPPLTLQPYMGFCLMHLFTLGFSFFDKLVPVAHFQFL